MSDDPSHDRIQSAARTLLERISDLPLDGDAEEVVAALFMTALAVAQRVHDPRSIARLLVTLAETQLEAATPPTEGRTTSGAAMHSAFEGAVELLTSRGLTREEVRAGMLGFAVVWTEKAEGPRATSARLYSAADALATKGVNRTVN